jgi:hypothetical protein
MKLMIRLLVFALTVILASVTQAADDGPRRDAQAIEVLKSMSEFLAGLERFTVTGNGSTDGRLDAGLIVSNPMEVKLRVQRPGSLQISRFDGESTKQIYLHEGSLSLYDTANKFYATAEVPDGIEAGMAFALEEYGIDAPLMDLLYQDVFTHLAGTSDPVLYLTDKSRAGGADCHHVAIRSAEVDIQLWVEEGDRPLPRQLILTSKWEGGAPRFVAQISWELEPDFASGDFEFTAPEGATQIEFTPVPAE